MNGEGRCYVHRAFDQGAEFDTPRYDVVRGFATLPDEAFSYFALMIFGMSHHTDGFSIESRAAMRQLALRIGDYFIKRWGDLENVKDTTP